jgi:hypothetical protein
MRTRGAVARLGLHGDEPPLTGSPTPLALLLQRIVTTLPPETHPLVLSHLPAVELVRLACVHKAFHNAWKSLQGQHPGKRYTPPSADILQWVRERSRLERAAHLGDVAVIQSMIAAGVDEHGTPLLEAKGKYGHRVVDAALRRAALGGHLQAVELLLDHGADVHADGDCALRSASANGHTAVVQLLLQHGANVHAGNDAALWLALQFSYTAVVELLIQHGAIMPSS